MIKSTRKLLLLLAVALISLSASTLRADSKLIIDSCWDRYYGLIYKGSDQGITVNLEFEVWRDGKQIGVFKIFGVEGTSSKGIFKPTDGNDVLKEGDLLKGPGGTEWAPAPKQEKKEEKSAKRSLKLSVDKSDEENKTDEAKKASDDKDKEKEFPRRINPKEDKTDSSADKKPDTSVKKEEKKEEKKEKKEEKKKVGDDKSKVITKPKEEKQSDKKQVVDKKEAKTAKQEKSGNKEKTRFGLKNSEKSKVQPAVASDDKAIAISKEEQDKSADKNTKKNEPEKLASAKSEEPAKEKPAEGKQKFGLNTGEGSTEPSTSVDENNAKTEPAQQETGGEKTKNKFGLISDLPEKKQSPSEASNTSEETKTTDKTEVAKEDKGEGSGKFGLKTSKTASDKGNKEVAKSEPAKKDKDEKAAEKESPKGLPVKLSPEKEDNSNVAGSGRKKKAGSKGEVAKVDNSSNNNSINDKQAGKGKKEETSSEKKPAEGESSKGLPVKLSPEKEDNSNLTANKREKKTENKEVASGEKVKQEKVEKVIPWTAQKHIYAADNYFYDRDYNLALEHYSAALTLDPKNEKAKSGIVDCSKKLGVAMEPKDKPKETAENKQQTFKAENFGTADTPSNVNKYDVADVENNYGVYLIQEKNYKEAIEWLNKAINDKPDEAIYYRNRAVAYFKAGDIVKAVYDAKAAYEKGDEKSKDLLLMLKKSLEENEKKQSDSNSVNKTADSK